MVKRYNKHINDDGQVVYIEASDGRYTEEELGLNEGFYLTDGKLEKSESLISEEKKEEHYNSFKNYLIAFLIFGSCVGVCFMPSSDNTTRTKPTPQSRQDCYDMYPSLPSDNDAWDNPGLITCLAKIEARK